jgi:hypothetical protein
VDQEVPMLVKMGREGPTFGSPFLIAQIIHNNCIGHYISIYHLLFFVVGCISLLFYFCIRAHLLSIIASKLSHYLSFTQLPRMNSSYQYALLTSNR